MCTLEHDQEYILQQIWNQKGEMDRIDKILLSRIYLHSFHEGWGRVKIQKGHKYHFATPNHQGRIIDFDNRASFYAQLKNAAAEKGANTRDINATNYLSSLHN